MADNADFRDLPDFDDADLHANELLEENHRSHAEITHVYAQLRAIKRYFASMESHLELAAELERDEALRWNRHLYGDDTGDLAAEGHVAFLRDILFPRLFRGSFLVMLFATFEDAVYTIADGAARRTGSAIAIHDFSGSVLSKGQKFFGELCGLSFPSGDSLANLRVLYSVRNSFAHQAGSSLLDDLTKDERRKSARDIRRLVGKTPGLVLAEEKYLVPSREFAERSVAVVVETVVKLAREAAPEYLYHEFWELDIQD